MSAGPVLSESLFDSIDEQLRGTDQLLATAYPGDRPDRQAVHTVYVPADAWEADLPQNWGAQALAAVKESGGMEKLARRVIANARSAESAVASVPREPSKPLEQEAAELAAAVEAKLRAEPIEDLRIDFEDGFGNRPDEEEDRWAIESAQRVRAALEKGSAPAFIGIRFKCMEAPLRRRGLRTLDLFIAHLIDDGELPAGLTLTLPKVSTVDQVSAMVEVARTLEAAHGLAERRIRFEVQVETPQVVLGPEGTVLVAPLIHAGDGRITSLHYGTYDYSASLGIAAAYQAMDHPAADFAKQQLLLAVAGTGVHLSDGSTNIIPVGDADAVSAAWDLHSGLVRRHLQRGIYQGWDMHPAQLPTRFLATFHFFREGFEAAARRISAYVHGESGAVMDEPATAKALAKYLQRAVVCGAIAADELEAATKLEPAELDLLARTGHLEAGV